MPGVSGLAALLAGRVLREEGGAMTDTFCVRKRKERPASGAAKRSFSRGVSADNGNMLTAFILDDGRISRETSPEALSRALRDPDAVFWLDMYKATDEELGLLDDVFGFHPLAIEDTIGYSQRPKIESYSHTGEGCKSGYFYMVFHGPDLKSFREKVRTKELDLFVSERYLITIHDEQMTSVEEVLQRAEADPRR